MNIQQTKSLAAILLLAVGLSDTALARPKPRPERVKETSPASKLQHRITTSMIQPKNLDQKVEPLPAFHRVSTGQGTITYWQ